MCLWSVHLSFQQHISFHLALFVVHFFIVRVAVFICFFLFVPKRKSCNFLYQCLVYVIVFDFCSQNKQSVCVCMVVRLCGLCHNTHIQTVWKNSRKTLGVRWLMLLMLCVSWWTNCKVCNRQLSASVANVVLIYVLFCVLTKFFQFFFLHLLSSSIDTKKWLKNRQKLRRKTILIVVFSLFWSFCIFSCRFYYLFIQST